MPCRSARRASISSRPARKSTVGTQVMRPSRTHAPRSWRRSGQMQEIALLDAHAELVVQALDPRCAIPFLFLTGNPGIGKTTAVVNFLRAHQDEGFLFF